jgi:hypothetical protein
LVDTKTRIARARLLVFEAKESIKRQIQNKFKPNMLPMKRNLVNKQVNEEQSE